MVASIKSNRFFATFLAFQLMATIATPLSSEANELHLLVDYECNKRENRITLTYLSAYDKKGEEVIRNKKSNQWSPEELIEVKDDNWVNAKTVKRQCKLKDGIYEIKSGAAPGNSNIQGRCGAFMSAWVEIRRNSKTLLPRHTFDNSCRYPESLITNKIVIYSGSNKPMFTKVNLDEFYK